MNQDNHKGEIWDVLTRYAMAFLSPPSEDALKIYCEKLVQFKPEELSSAFSKLIEKTKYYPHISELIAEIRPTANPDDEGREAANLVVQAVSKFGRYKPEKAEEFVGELGWRVVERFGGWENLCGTLNIDNIGIITAQLRNTAQTTLRRHSIGLGNTPPSLPKPQNENLKKIDNVYQPKTLEE